MARAKSIVMILVALSVPFLMASVYNGFVGTSSDGHDSDTLGGRTEQMLDHAHNQTSCYPTLANGVTLTGDASAWTLGSLAEVVPASTIASVFDIHQVNIEGFSAADVYEIVLYYGAGDTEFARIRATRSSVSSGIVQHVIVCPLIPANSRIRAAVASKGGGSDTVDISLQYHTY